MILSILNLLLVLLVAWLAGLIAARFGYPSVLGELFAGIILGPPLLGLLDATDALTVLAELGILVMMLYIGMEIDPKELRKASKGGALAAVGGFITPFVLCYLIIVGTGHSQMAGIFVGVAAGVTSLTTKSRILFDLQLLDTRIAHVMMAGALIADTLSLVIFAGVIGVGEGGEVDITSIGLTFLKAVGFFVVAAVVGGKLIPLIARPLEKLGTTATFTFIIIFGLAMAEGAELAGMHGVLGAFLAGLFLREQVFGRTFSLHLMDLVRHASIGLLAPIFFVTAGFAVTLDVIGTDPVLLLGVIALATVGKIVGVALFYLTTGYGWREGLVIGGGMNGRGAVEIIMAQIGLNLGLISQDMFSILVFMAIATTATVPLLLRWGTEWLGRRGELIRSEGERNGVLIIGAGATSRTLGAILVRSQPVWLVDRNVEHCELARREGLSVVVGDALDEHVLAEAHASELKTFIALTPNPEVNALAARLAREVFLIPNVHVVNGGGDQFGQTALAAHLRTTMLFDGEIRLDEWNYRLERGEAVTSTIAVGDSGGDLPEPDDSRTDAVPIAVLRDEQYEPYHGETELRERDRIVYMRAIRAPIRMLDRFDLLVREAPILDIPGSIDAENFFRLTAEAIAPEFGIEPEQMARHFLDREYSSSTVILPGMAVPHVTVPGNNRFKVLLARCRQGVLLPGQDEPVNAVFVFAGSPDERNFHLKALAAVASIVQSPDFEPSWREAPDAEALRQIVLSSERRRLNGDGVSPTSPSGQQPER